MRHKRVGRKLGVTTKHRRAMFRNMVTDLFRHEKIKTTDTRAKELRRVAEKYITIAKKGTLSARRAAAAFVKDKEVIQKLFDELAARFKDRPGGYTRIVKLGVRTGDNAPISLIELIQEEYKPKKKRPKRAKKKKAETAAAEPEVKSTKKESAEELGLSDTEEKTEQLEETKAQSTEATQTETAPEPEVKAEPETAQPAAEEATEQSETEEQPEAEAKAEPEQAAVEEPEAKSEPQEQEEQSVEETSEPEVKAQEDDSSQQAAEEESTDKKE